MITWIWCLNEHVDSCISQRNVSEQKHLKMFSVERL
jgi:hypothetical protein